jgi:uncharacterized protein
MDTQPEVWRLRLPGSNLHRGTGSLPSDASGQQLAMTPPSSAPRYTSRDLPSYSYVPGQHPHPVSDPRGHSYGHAPEVALALDETNWPTNLAWLWAIDLFNYGFYWEAHEAWEGLWHAAGRRGPKADFLKGLIKLAAAGVKAREGRPEGVRLHAGRAAQLLEPTRSHVMFGVEVDPLLSVVHDLASGHSWPPTAPQIVLRPTSQ